MLEPDIVELDSSDSDDNIHETKSPPCGFSEDIIIDLESDDSQYHNILSQTCDFNMLQESGIHISPTFIELMELCCRLQDNREMRDIMNQIMIPSYLNADKTYIDSRHFKDLLNSIVAKIKEKNTISFIDLKKVIVKLKSNTKKSVVGDIITLDCDDENKEMNIIRKKTSNENKKKHAPVLGLVNNDNLNKSKEGNMNRKKTHFSNKGKRKINNIERGALPKQLKTIQTKQSKFIRKSFNFSDETSKNLFGDSANNNSVLGMNPNCNLDVIHNSDSENKQTDKLRNDISISNPEVTHNGNLETRQDNKLTEIQNGCFNAIQDCNLKITNICSLKVAENNSNQCNMSDNFPNLTGNQNSSFIKSFYNFSVGIQNDILVNKKEHARDTATTIKILESQIEECKNQIKICEEAEVDLDNVNSPYIMGDKLKAKLLQLYNELCTLTDNPVELKPSLVTLEVPKDQPKGPAQRLQMFLNNAKQKGHPFQFPDFHDVVKCVATANIEDSLGWSSKKVLYESRNLFTQCGLQLQKRRQRREWRDLQELMDDTPDPADLDPGLEAKLQQNKLVGRREREVMEMFSQAEKSMANEISQNCDEQNNALTDENKLVVTESTEVIEIDSHDNEDDYTDESEDSDIEVIDDNFVFTKDENNLLVIKKEEIKEENVVLMDVKNEYDFKTESPVDENDVLKILAEIEQTAKQGRDFNVSIIHEEPGVTIIFDSSDDETDDEIENKTDKEKTIKHTIL